MHAYSYSNDRLRAYGLLAFLAVVAAIGANAAADHFHLGPAWLVSAPTVAASFAILYEVLDRWAWRWRAVRAAGIATTPVVAGRFTGTLHSVWQGGTDVPVEVEIDQTWSSLVVRLQVTGHQQTSISISMAAALVSTGQRQARLTYMYRNTIRPGFAAPDMSDHDGTAELTFTTASASVTGRYYNFRGRQGTIDLLQQ